MRKLLAVRIVLAGVALALTAPAVARALPVRPVTVPFFTGSFSHGGRVYSYRMVGSDPAGPAAVTRVRVELVPLRFVFADGATLSAGGVVEAVLRSPLFRRARFLTGFTQYGDAILRAEYWRRVRRKDWHVLLAPRALPAVSVRVPRGAGWAARSVHGGLAGSVDEGFWTDRIVPRLIRRLRLDPRDLTAFLAYHVGIGGGLGEHESFVAGHRVWSYLEASWEDPSVSCCAAQDDVHPLSHELAEWLNNPFAAMHSLRKPDVITLEDNLVPPWRTAEIACYPYLEVADAVNERPIAIDGYALADVTFLSWFARQTPSTAFDGRYDYLGRAFRAPPQSCGLRAAGVPTPVTPAVARRRVGTASLPASARTIPYFTAEFRYRGRSYAYRMVGSDPRGAPRVTRVPVEILPVRFRFADGTTLSAAGEVRAVLRSPLFRPARFLSGTTQYGDAMQRAELWRYVHATDWHVLLSPTVGPTLDIAVPGVDGWAARSEHGALAGAVDEAFWSNTVVPSIINQLGLDPHALSVFLVHRVHFYSGAVFGQFAPLSFDEGSDSTTDLSRVWTWVAASWEDTGDGCCGDFDTFELSKGMLDWLDNPFDAGAGGYAVPAWRTGEYPCGGRPSPDASGHELRRGLYHLADPAFLSWFARQSPSAGIDGRYDYLGELRVLPASCGT